MTFQLLAPPLHSTAMAAEKYFANHYGAKGFKHESTIDDRLSLKPTLSAKLQDGYILCVEVGEKAYSNSLDTFVVECSSLGFPAKLFVALQSAKDDPDFASNLKKAKARGVGVVEMGSLPQHIFYDALSLSLFGVRQPKLHDFRKDKREAVRQAVETFTNGNPVKGCLSVYEEIEALTRAFAKRSKLEGWWRNPHSGEKGPSANVDTGPWAKVLKELTTFLDVKKCRKKCPLISDGLLASARGLTDPRNMTAHKPSSVQKVIERDEKLRTWFESTCDLYKGWCDATRVLKL
jgi:hypothetical protein